MNSILLLCDWAEEMKGKLYIMGGGWSHLVIDRPVTIGLAVRLEVPWNETNQKHAIQVALLDADNQPVASGDKPVNVEGEFEVGRPIGTTAGIPLIVPLAFRFQNLDLLPGRYMWRLLVDNEPSGDVSFEAITKKGG